MQHNESLTTRDLLVTDPAAGQGGDSEPGSAPRAAAVSESSARGGPDQARPGASPGQDLAPRDASALSSENPDRGQTTANGGQSDDRAPLLADELSANLQQRWEQVQTRFVDDPRAAVQDADGLVATVMKQLAEDFAQERSRLEAQWDRGEGISTEDLRVALTRYRSFFQRLLAAT